MTLILFSLQFPANSKDYCSFKHKIIFSTLYNVKHVLVNAETNSVHFFFFKYSDLTLEDRGKKQETKESIIYII